MPQFLVILASCFISATAIVSCREVGASPRSTGDKVVHRSMSGPLAPTIAKGDDAAKALRRLVEPRPRGSRPAALDIETLAAVKRVHTDPGEIPQLKVQVDGEQLDLPLEHTHVEAQLTGYVARVEVTQTYKNPFAYPIEAIYVFPLPENSAVDDMRIVIAERVIQAEIRKRNEARQIYQDAKKQGHTAALLEQERPNIFTQSVANIEPGSNIDVVIRYLQTLTYDAGEYEFVFPMVVGPRFIPGAPTDKRTGSGWSPDTTEVPDASRITPPVVGAGYRSGHDISLSLTATAGLPVVSSDVPTHEVVQESTQDGSLRLKLASHDSIPNRDFVLRFRVDGKEPQGTVLAGMRDSDGFLTLILQPPQLDVDRLIGQRELIFVVDVSGSMHGVPLAMCQDAMEEAIRKMRPVDTFNVITFAGRTGQAFSAPRPANEHNIQEALSFVRGLRAGGGTYMLDGVRAALSPPVQKGRGRYVFFLTDGYVGNERQIHGATQQFIAELERRGERARVFGFGVGASVNRHLLDGLGKAGKGLTVYATTREDPTLAVNRFYRYIDHPLLSDVQIDWGDLEVEQVYPTRIPDLFASRPLVVHARYDDGGEGTVRVRGKVDGRDVSIPVEVALPEADNEQGGTLATLWARAKIGWLRRDLWTGPAAQAVEAITDLGLKFRIVTQYTSFVAVDRSKRVDGESRTVVQPVEVPEGVDPVMSGAHSLRAARSLGKLRSSSRRRKTFYAAPAPASNSYGLRTRADQSRPAAGPRFLLRGKSAGGQARRQVAPGSAAAEPAVPAKKAASSSEHGRSSLTVRGGLSEQDVAQVLDQHRAEIERLVKAAKRRAGAAAIQVRLRWFITAQGKVIQARVMGGSLRDPALEKALLDLINGLSFPRPSGGRTARVTYLVAD